MSGDAVSSGQVGRLASGCGQPPGSKTHLLRHLAGQGGGQPTPDQSSDCGQHDIHTHTYIHTYIDVNTTQYIHTVYACMYTAVYTEKWMYVLYVLYVLYVCYEHSCVHALPSSLCAPTTASQGSCRGSMRRDRDTQLLACNNTSHHITPHHTTPDSYSCFEGTRTIHTHTYIHQLR